MDNDRSSFIRRHHVGLWVLLMLVAGAPVACAPATQDTESAAAFERAHRRGEQAKEGFTRARRYMEAWLAQADPQSGLIPRNLGDSRDIWNAHDAAADNYAFMVLTAALTDTARYHGRLRQMLRTEKELAARVGRLPDTYSFSKRGFYHDSLSLSRLVFGASEYIKDGLLPLTEWIGPSPWSEHMIEMLDDVWTRASVQTPHGRIVATSHEINGEMLQVLSRIYWLTGNARYLDLAIRLGDYYLLGDHHPTRDTSRLRLRDHGNEVVAGLTELYATVHFARPEKKEAYRAPLHAMLDRILAVGRNEHGLFYNAINPQSGDVLDAGTADTYGYVYNGFYTVYLIDSTETYRQAVRGALSALPQHYRHYNWEGGSADGDADAIESAINLHNREPMRSTADWIDSEIRFMWSKQDTSHLEGDRAWQGSGIIEGWHGDGNFARTSLMYSLWKTQGLHVRPWREDVVVGSVEQKGRLYVSITAEQPWTGRLRFDVARHRQYMHLPLDWPRINQFPEWFTVGAEQKYAVRGLAGGNELTYSGEALRRGIPIQLSPGAKQHILVERIDNNE